MLTHTQDPFTSTSRCVQRLLDQHSKSPRLIIAVDIDDTLYDFHQKGYTFPRVIALVRRAQAAGFWIVAFTASAKERHPFIHEHCASLGIRLDSINRNVIDSAFGHDGKMFYNLLLDDRASLGQACDVLERVLDAVSS